MRVFPEPAPAGGNECFPRAARLRSRAEFQDVRLRGRSVAGTFFRLSALRTEQTLPARLGIVTTRKSGSAVERNRFRRQIRELFRKHRGTLPPGLWLVVIARHRSGQASHRCLEQEWLRHLHRLSILKTGES